MEKEKKFTEEQALEIFDACETALRTPALKFDVMQAIGKTLDSVTVGAKRLRHSLQAPVIDAQKAKSEFFQNKGINSNGHYTFAAQADCKDATRLNTVIDDAMGDVEKRMKEAHEVDFKIEIHSFNEKIDFDGVTGNTFRKYGINLAT